MATCAVEIQRELAALGARGVGHRGNGEDAAVDAHVAHLRFVRDAAERDDGPVFELERRQLTQLDRK